jgi:hypothetical protein
MIPCQPPSTVGIVVRRDGHDPPLASSGRAIGQSRSWRSKLATVLARHSPSLAVPRHNPPSAFSAPATIHRWLHRATIRHRPRRWWYGAGHDPPFSSHKLPLALTYAGHAIRHQPRCRLRTQIGHSPRRPQSIVGRTPPQSASASDEADRGPWPRTRLMARTVACLWPGDTTTPKLHGQREPTRGRGPRVQRTTIRQG